MIYLESGFTYKNYWEVKLIVEPSISVLVFLPRIFVELQFFSISLPYRILDNIFLGFTLSRSTAANLANVFYLEFYTIHIIIDAIVKKMQSKSKMHIISINI